MTDLMCHPEDFAAWSDRLDKAGGCPLFGTAATAPPPTSSAAASPAGVRRAAGHSGIMRLAASLILDLARHGVLYDLMHAPPGSAPRCAPS